MSTMANNSSKFSFFVINKDKMPELPEVEIMRRYFETAVLGKEISGLEFHDPLFKVFKSSPQDLEDALIGKTFVATERIGKYLFAQMDSGKWLHLHFGMTGNLELFRSDTLPKYTRFVFVFEDGDKLAFRDLRKFGLIQVVESPLVFKAENTLGDDLLVVDSKVFVDSMINRKIAVKTALLDQKHFAGIGNWIADEVLFNCGVHPQKPCSELSEEKLLELLRNAQDVVREAIEKDTHYGDFPSHFFVNYRKEEALHPHFPKSPVKRLVVGGRGTFIVPEKQIR